MKIDERNRFVFTKKIKDEFGLKESDIPPHMREFLAPGVKFTNFLDQNSRLASYYDQVQKVMYLSKLKFNIES